MKQERLTYYHNQIFQIKRILWDYRLLFMAAAIVTLVMNHFCRTNDSDALRWILTPTTWWVSVLGGISFEYLPHRGYVNHYHQFLIAPSCSGSRFMLIVFLMLVCSFLFSRQPEERDGSKERGTLIRESVWFGFSMIFAYATTIFVNGIRITVSIFLPAMLDKMHLMDGWLNAGQASYIHRNGNIFCFSVHYLSGGSADSGTYCERMGALQAVCSGILVSSDCACPSFCKKAVSQ